MATKPPESPPVPGLADVRAVVFDLDGTVVDAFADITAAVNHALALSGLQPLPHATVLNFVGNGMRKLAERALRASGETLEERRLDSFVETVASYYQEHPADFARPYPGAPEGLRALRKMGIRLGLLSNKRHSLTVPILEKLGLAPLFDRIQGETPEFGLKPDPAGLLHLLGALETPPSRALMVGDTTPDAQVARNANLRFVGVSYGLKPREELLELGALRVLDRLDELPALLQNQRT